MRMEKVLRRKEGGRVREVDKGLEVNFNLEPFPLKKKRPARRSKVRNRESF